MECAIWGSESTTPDVGSKNIVRTLDWKSALNGAKAVILPLPVTTDGVRLNCVNNIHSSNMYIPRITEIIEETSPETLVFGGKLTRSMIRFGDEHKVKLIDYYESEEFQIKNSVPTAEGAIAVAIREMNITWSGSKVAIALKDFGIELNNAFVYGCFGVSKISFVVPISTISPKYITATLSQKYSTVLKS